MKTIHEFENFFNNNMFDDLSALEERRKRILKFAILAYLVVFVGVALSFFLAFLFCFEGNCILFAIIGGIAASIIIGVVIFYVNGRDKEFYLDFKEKVIHAVIKFISPDLEYNAKNYIGLDTFQRSRIFTKRVDRYRGDDMVEGKIDKTHIWFSEVHAEYKQTTTDSKGRTKTSYHKIFKGLFFIADFNKHFSSSTVVMPNLLGKSGIARFFNKMSPGRHEKFVSLEDPDFNKYFVVYGEDQIEARYILSTSLMKRITDFKQKHKNTIYLSFVNSFLYVGISYSKNLFEPSYFKKLTRFEIVKNYFEDVQLAISIVEELNLNTRIWTKQ
ncbi:MAG: DUF3137 domain-containing protein [Bacteroidetes bacterium]|nr:DUF3137 domain-containing protein [Bacteroidota bacterium]